MSMRLRLMYLDLPALVPAVVHDLPAHAVDEIAQRVVHFSISMAHGEITVRDGPCALNLNVATHAELVARAVMKMRNFNCDPAQTDEIATVLALFGALP